MALGEGSQVLFASVRHALRIAAVHHRLGPAVMTRVAATPSLRRWFGEAAQVEEAPVDYDGVHITESCARVSSRQLS
jgi:hypothetical protein